MVVSPGKWTWLVVAFLSTPLLADDAALAVKAIQNRHWSQLKSLKSVTKLDLSRVRINDADLIHLAELSDLKELALEGTYFDQSPPNLITDAGLKNLSELKQLEILRLDGQAITTLGTKHLSQFPKLHTLDVRLTSIGYRGQPELRSLKNLRVLRLGNVTPETIEEVSQLAQLETLEVDGNRLNDDCLAFLSELHQLKKLDVHNYWMPVTAIQYAQSVKEMPANERMIYECVRTVQSLKTENARLQDLQSARRIAVLAGLAPTGEDDRTRTFRRRYLSKVGDLLETIRGEGRVSSVELMELADITYEMSEKYFHDNPERKSQIDLELRRILDLVPAAPRNQKPTPLGDTGLSMVFPGEVRVGRGLTKNTVTYSYGHQIVVEIHKQEEDIPPAFLVIVASGEAGLYNGTVISTNYQLYQNRFPAADVVWTFNDQQEGLGFRRRRMLQANGFLIDIVYKAPAAVPKFASQALFDSLEPNKKP